MEMVEIVVTVPKDICDRLVARASEQNVKPADLIGLLLASSVRANSETGPDEDIVLCGEDCSCLEDFQR